MSVTTCIICGKPAPGTGTVIRALGRCLFACEGQCADLVMGCLKDYSNSSRGRKRSRSEWLEMIAGIRAKFKEEAETMKHYRVHLRCLIRRDMPEVLTIERLTENRWGEDDFMRCLRQRNCIGHVAEHGEKVVGFIIYELHKYKIRILNFAVHPDWQRGGIGRQMIEKMKGKLSSHRRVEIDAIVPEECLSMLLFLKRQRFRASPMRHGDEEIRMVFGECSEKQSWAPCNRISAYMEDRQGSDN
jgi:[ribosomal protein S18]-alanine N-acetyltransferase